MILVRSIGIYCVSIKEVNYTSVNFDLYAPNLSESYDAMYNTIVVN